MIVTRYLASHLRDILEHNRLKVSKLSHFNDPFEFRYRHVGDFGRSAAKRTLRTRMKTPEFWATLREAYALQDKSKKNLKKVLQNKREEILDSLQRRLPKDFLELIDKVPEYADRTTRIICFSQATQRPLEEILLWSHYTNGHSGFRIWVDLSNEALPLSKTFRVSYSEELPAIENKQVADLDLYESIIEIAMGTKAKCWEYEAEVRSFIPRGFFVTEVTKGNEIDYVKIRPESIVRIDFGVRYDRKERDRLISDFSEVLANRVELRQAKRSYDRYELEYSKL